MCGIVGVWSQEGKASRKTIGRMVRLISHRGPDGEGYFLAPPIVMGHRRLAIIDIEGGKQPMSTEDGRYTIAFNGEIYNFVEVRKELEAKGAIFRTRSDTEVILQGYAVWGERCLDKMIGMFAFAIWDREEEELFLARDRVGKKPLVYFWDGKTFAFASETKGLVGAGLFDPKLDAKSVDLFFALGWVPSPLSIFMYVRKLQPGHFMKFKDGRVEIKRYWFPEKLLSCDKRKKEDRLQDFKSLFANAVNIRLRSDVPIGIFLSGGIDSSVVALEAVSQGYSAHALTVFFDHDRIDVNYAVKVARLLGIPQECIEVHGNICDDLEDIFWHYDEPFADTSSIPTFYIARAAKDRFKVILNGDGGDELFGGYRRYERIRMRYFLKRMASCLGLRDGGSNALQIWFGSRAIFREHERKALLKGRLAGNILVA